MTSHDEPVEAGGPEPGGEEDERLLAELRELGRLVDPVPADVVFAARGSLVWRRVDAELAELSFDSTVEHDLELAGVRGGDDDVRLVSFEGPDLTVEVEIAAEGDRRRLIGQLVPPQPAAVELRTAAGAEAVRRSTEADGLGRFVLDRVVAGPASLRCVLTPGRAVETGWLVI